MDSAMAKNWAGNKTLGNCKGVIGTDMYLIK